MSRASFSEVHFEQFKVSRGKLFKECGRIRGGRYLPATQEVSPLTPVDFAAIRAKAWEIHAALRAKERTFEEPGSNSTFLSPGKFTLSIDFDGQVNELKTSHTSILHPTSIPARSSNELVGLIRKAAGLPLCGMNDFFELS